MAHIVQAYGESILTNDWGRRPICVVMMAWFIAGFIAELYGLVTPELISIP